MSENQYQSNQYQQSPNPYYYYPQVVPGYYPAHYRQMPAQNQQVQPGINLQGMLPMQQSFIENILRLNRGKMATVHMTFEGGNGSNTKVFKGRIEAAGRDHIILSDPESERRYLLLMVYLDYVTFDERINYSYPFQTTDQLSSYEPR